MSLFAKPIAYCVCCFTQNVLGSEFCGRCGVKLPTSQIEVINAVAKSAQGLISDRYTISNGIIRLQAQQRELEIQIKTKERELQSEMQGKRREAQLEIDRAHLEARQAKAEAERIKTANQQLESDLESFKPLFDEQIEQLDKLQAETTVQELGYYAPHYNFESSQAYRLRLDDVREKQKSSIKNAEAAKCLAEWTVNGSRAAGRKQTNDTLKLMLYAFNGESDVAIAKVKFNNVFDAERRIEKAFELINKLGSVQQCYVSQSFLNLKLEELYLFHEYQEKIYEEKEEQRRIREQMREEEIARREIEKVLSDAERDENRFSEALRKATEDAEKAVGEKQARLLSQIDALEQKLREAQLNKERAISRAQMTRSGHVYVISNIGSFGDDVYKIGMTRRLDPMDRVRELGDASVPFQFDVHAIIFSDDAPALEANLHRIFRARRVNAINERKEFFRVTLDEIADAVHQNHGEIEFTKVADAVDFRKTLAFLKDNQEQIH